MKSRNSGPRNSMCQYIECLNCVNKSGQFSTIRVVEVAMPQIPCAYDSLDSLLHESTVTLKKIIHYTVVDDGMVKMRRKRS